MYQLKRGKRPELLKRGFKINQWNECEKTLKNKKMTVRKRNICIFYIYEDEFWGRTYKESNITEKKLIEFDVFDLIEEI